MILGKIGEWIGKLDPGYSVIVTRDDIKDSASHYLGGGLSERDEFKMVINEVNGDEYKGYQIFERPDGRWQLTREGL